MPYYPNCTSNIFYRILQFIDEKVADGLVVFQYGLIDLGCIFRKQVYRTMAVDGYKL